MRVINPATEEVIADVREHGPDDVERRLRQAERAFADWRRTPLAERARLMHRAAELLRGRRNDLAPLMVREMGKPVGGAEAEVDKCALVCDYFADHAAAMLAPEPIATDADRSYVRYDPIGPVLAIMPWNFPFWQVIRFAAPTLMAGNVAVLKHAPNVPGCSTALEDLFRDAGFPPGVFTHLLLDDHAAAERVIDHPAIRGVTLTGSGRAGMAVAARAGKVLKKTVLELGGSDPFIVIPPKGEGAEAFLQTFLQETARQAANARCICSGQSCIAAKRFIVVGGEDVAYSFERRLTCMMRNLTVGDPMDRATTIGPLARLDLLDHLHGQVRRAVAAGARLLTGGERLLRKGYFYAPTVLADVRPGNPAFDEETFGPVAAVTPPVHDVEEAVELANATRYGLGASVWTPDAALAERVAEQIDAGCVFINGAVKSDPRLPFGGVKDSGYGRELAAMGLREFVNAKTVWVKQGQPPKPTTPKRGE